MTRNTILRCLLAGVLAVPASLQTGWTSPAQTHDPAEPVHADAIHALVRSCRTDCPGVPAVPHAGTASVFPRRSEAITRLMLSGLRPVEPPARRIADR